MKLVSFDQGRIGVIEGDDIIDVSHIVAAAPAWPPTNMLQLIDQ
jgi:hypothetical protein